jgi:hypothetical protein
MKSSFRFAVALALGLVACGKGGGGGLTKENVKEYRDHIDMNASYEDAVKAATDKFGAPTKTEDKKTIWTGKDGNRCFNFTLENYSGKAANGVESTDCPK